MSNPFLASLLAGKTPAPAGSIEAPGPLPAVAVTPDAGSMAENLKNILSGFAAKAGVAPGATRVNPPEAAKVLQTATAAEVAGAAEPPESDGPAVEPPTGKPADVLAAEAAKRTRRTAAVVQEELDAALERIAGLEKAGSVSYLDRARAAEECVSQLREEAKICEADKAKAYKRADEVEATLAQAIEAIQTLQAQLASAPSGGGYSDCSVGALCDALKALGFEVTLRRL